MNKATLLLLLVVLCCYGQTTLGREEQAGWRARGRAPGRSRGKGEDLFLLSDARQVVRTDAGSMKIVRSVRGRIVEKPLHIGFIVMEPHSLFIPQYTDSSLILFVRRGNAKIGAIHENELVERQLKHGDIYRIPAGSAFYLLNAESEEKLHIVCSIDTSESFELTNFQSFFIGGGMHPASILTGFNKETLASAFNVTMEELEDILSREKGGPIVHVRESEHPTIWTEFLNKEHNRRNHLKRIVTGSSEWSDQEKDDVSNNNEEERKTWLWRKLLRCIFPLEDERRGSGSRRSVRDEGTFNLFEKSPDFKNDYGWSVSLDESEYESLKHSGIGIYLVNLSKGSMMAPHVNPTATEYGIVLHGSGRIQIGYPNGSAAMNAEVKEGDVFWIPRYFPFCQISSNSETLEFFGFTTSSRKNRPQFLVGKSSVLQMMRGPELAASFGLSDRRMSKFLDAQREAVILPSPYVLKRGHEAEDDGDDDEGTLDEEEEGKSVGGGYAADA